MRNLVLSMLIIFCFAKSFLSQTAYNHEMTFSISVTRMDFFTGVQLSRQIKLWKPMAMLELGINRTFFQQRLYPRLTAGTAYFFLNREKFRLGPQFTYSYSFLKINKNSSHFHKWNETYVGSRFEFGSKIRFTNVISAGWMNERFYNQLTGEKDGVNSFGFYVNMGICYAW